MQLHNTEFFSAEDGAVTVDWVVLTAGLVGLGLATMSVVSGGVEDASGDIDRTLNRSIVERGLAFGDVVFASVNDLDMTYYGVEDGTVSMEVRLGQMRGLDDFNAFNNQLRFNEAVDAGMDTGLWTDNAQIASLVAHERGLVAEDVYADPSVTDLRLALQHGLLSNTNAGSTMPANYLNGVTGLASDALSDRGWSTDDLAGIASNASASDLDFHISRLSTYRGGLGFPPSYIDTALPILEAERAGR